jgi:hypothetical protein
MKPRDGYKWGLCHRCNEHRWMLNGLCPYCHDSLRNESGTRDYYDEPMFYECAMCGMEIVSFETVRGHKYCHSCAATERHG